MNSAQGRKTIPFKQNRSIFIKNKYFILKNKNNFNITSFGLYASCKTV